MTDFGASVESIFSAALAIQSPVERAGYLDQVCAGDEELRRRVERLLAAQPHLGRFLEFDAADAWTARESLLEQPGMRIGPYRLMEQIGEGGMGLVFVAEQEAPLRRKLAIKVLKPGLDTREVIARFEGERQALALLDHPNIAKVLDAGTTPSGRPFFALELVRGLSITEFCDRQQFTVRQRLALFVDVCLAVQHAHLKGIIHRDLKPGNILVTLHNGTPVAKVIDFGVAKAIGQRLTDRTIYTRFTQIIGTPLYMSPEQAELNGLDIDTRADVYSLGVLLYELLTGVTPFDQERLKTVPFEELRRIIQEQEPPQPSTRVSTLAGQTQLSLADARAASPERLRRQLKGELDWIVMRALEKDRSRRYESAGALAADVLRYLHDEPVIACPPSRFYRWRKLLRRHRAAAAAIATIGASLLLGTAASVSQMLEAQAARRQANLLLAESKQRLKDEAAARQEAERQRLRAERNLETAHEAVERYLTAVSETRLTDIPGFEPLRKELLASALLHYEVFLRDDPHDPISLANVAGASFRVGRIQLAMDEPDKAVASLERGCDLVSKLVRDPRTTTAALRRLAGVQWTGPTQYHSTRPPTDPRKQRRLVERAIGMWTQMAEREADEPGFRSDLAVMYADLAELQAGEGERQAALESYRRSRELWQRLVRDQPLAVRYRVGLVGCCERVGRLSAGIGSREDALAAYREGMHLAQQLVQEAPERVPFQLLLAESQVSVGKSLVGSDPRESESLLQQALERYRRISAAFPTVPAYREETAVAAYDFAIHLSESERPADAAASLRDAIGLLERVAQDFPHQSDQRRRLAQYHYALGLVLDQAGLSDDATESYHRALALRERLAAEQPQVGRYLEELAWQLAVCPHANLRDPARAVDLARRAVERAPSHGTFWRTLGVAQYRAGDYVGALRSLEKSLEYPNASRVPHWFLAMTHWSLGEKDQARSYFDTARRWMDENRPNNQELRHFRREAEELFQQRHPADLATPSHK